MAVVENALTDELLRSVALYAMNNSPQHIVESVFPGENPGYINEKVALIKKHGFLYWVCNLDDVRLRGLCNEVNRWSSTFNY